MSNNHSYPVTIITIIVMFSSQYEAKCKCILERGAHFMHIHFSHRHYFHFHQNLVIERIWVEVNSRVNYHLKRILLEMEDCQEIDMTDDVVKYCVSFVI